MARRIRQAVEIAASPEACWRAFRRRAEWPRWFPLLESLEGPPGDVELVVGDELHLRLVFHGRGATVRVHVAEVEPGRRVRWLGRGFGVTGDHAFSVEPAAGGARFVSDETFSGLPVRLLPRRLFDALEREAAAGLARFAALVTAA